MICNSCDTPSLSLCSPLLLSSLPPLSSLTLSPSSLLLVQCSSVEEFDELLAGLTHNHRRAEDGEGGVEEGGASTYSQGLQFVYHTMTGQEQELCPGGSHKELTYVTCTCVLHGCVEYSLPPCCV